MESLGLALAAPGVGNTRNRPRYRRSSCVPAGQRDACAAGSSSVRRRTSVSGTGASSSQANQARKHSRRRCGDNSRQAATTRAPLRCNAGISCATTSASTAAASCACWAARLMLSSASGNAVSNAGQTAVRSRLRANRASTLLASSTQLKRWRRTYASTAWREQPNHGRAKPTPCFVALCGIADSPAAPAPRRACSNQVSA